MMQISRPINPGIPVHALSPDSGAIPFGEPGSRKAGARRRGALPLEIGFLAAHGVRPEPAALRRHGGDPGGGVARRGGAGAQGSSRGGGLLPGARGGARAALRAAPAVARARYPHSLTAGLAPGGRGEGLRDGAAPRGTGRHPRGPAAPRRPRRGDDPVRAARRGLRRRRAAHRRSRRARPAAAAFRPVLPGRHDPRADRPRGPRVARLERRARARPPVRLGARAASGSGPCSSAWSCCASRPCGSSADQPARIAAAAAGPPSAGLHGRRSPARGEPRRRKLIAALRALDYPAAKLDIKIVIEADDRETADAIEEVGLAPGWPS